MKQFSFLTFSFCVVLQIVGGICENMLIDFVNKLSEKTRNDDSIVKSDTGVNIMNTLPMLKNIQRDKSLVDNRFFYTGFDWTLNLLPTIILIKLAFIGGLFEDACHVCKMITFFI